MSQRDRHRQTHGKHRKRKPGAHKRAASPDTKAWERDHLIPRCPPWLDQRMYVKLAELRSTL